MNELSSVTVQLNTIMQLIMDWLMLVPYRLQSSFYVKGVQVCKNSLAVNESRCSRIVGYMLLKNNVAHTSSILEAM